MKNIILLGSKYSQCSSLNSAEKTFFVMSSKLWENFHALVKSYNAWEVWRLNCGKDSCPRKLQSQCSAGNLGVGKGKCAGKLLMC